MNNQRVAKELVMVARELEAGDFPNFPNFWMDDVTAEYVNLVTFVPDEPEWGTDWRDNSEASEKKVTSILGKLRRDMEKVLKGMAEVSEIKVVSSGWMKGVSVPGTNVSVRARLESDIQSEIAMRLNSLRNIE